MQMNYLALKYIPFEGKKGWESEEGLFHWDQRHVHLNESWDVSASQLLHVYKPVFPLLKKYRMFWKFILGTMHTTVLQL